MLNFIKKLFTTEKIVYVTRKKRRKYAARKDRIYHDIYSMKVNDIVSGDGKKAKAAYNLAYRTAKKFKISASKDDKALFYICRVK